jgi:phosphonate transport system substrate-binding protein
VNRIVLPLSLALLATVLSACGAAQVAAEASPESSPRHVADGRTLVIGSVSDDPGEEAEIFQPFIDFVAERLAGSGVSGGEVVVTDTAEEMAELMSSGEVDLYVDSMLGVTTAVTAGAGQPFLRRWKDGEPTYRSIIVTRRDSGITAVDQLRGRTIAFEEQESTDGHFLPSASMRQAGMSLSRISDPSSPVAPDAVGYIFSGDDENTVFLVLAGRVAAGALSEEDLAENAGSRLDELVVLTSSVDVPRHGVVVRSGLEPELVQALRELLTTLHESAGGLSALHAFDDTARFDALTADALAPVLDLRATFDAATP